MPALPEGNAGAACEALLVVDCRDWDARIVLVFCPTSQTPPAVLIFRFL
jgi:hypothetical protein